MAVSAFPGLSYCPADPADPTRQFDAYCAVQGGAARTREKRPLLVFVHGGAWRSEDKNDHADLARTLAEATGSPVFVPNYRLTGRAHPNLRHPAHAEDVLQFLEFLLLWQSDAIPELAAALDASSGVYLIGHSCSAHMLAAIILDSDSATPSLAPTPQLLQAVKGVIFSEGIYDLDALCHRFPKYHEWFIDDAFGACEDYGQYNVSKYSLRRAKEGGRAASWLIIHSKGDELIDVAQSEAMYAQLCALYGDRAAAHVSQSLDTLSRGHDEILRGDDGYIDLVRTFVQRVEGAQL